MALHGHDHMHHRTTCRTRHDIIVALAYAREYGDISRRGFTSCAAASQQNNTTDVMYPSEISSQGAHCWSIAAARSPESCGVNDAVGNSR